MITPRKEIFIFHETGSSHDTKEKMEFEIISHDDDASPQGRQIKGSLQVQHKPLAKERQ